MAECNIESDNEAVVPGQEQLENMDLETTETNVELHAQLEVAENVLGEMEEGMCIADQLLQSPWIDETKLNSNDSKEASIIPSASRTIATENVLGEMEKQRAEGVCIADQQLYSPWIDVIKLNSIDSKESSISPSPSILGRAPPKPLSILTETDTAKRLAMCEAAGVCMPSSFFEKSLRSEKSPSPEYPGITDNEASPSPSLMFAIEISAEEKDEREESEKIKPINEKPLKKNDLPFRQRLMAGFSRFKSQFHREKSVAKTQHQLPKTKQTIKRIPVSVMQLLIDFMAELRRVLRTKKQLQNFYKKDFVFKSIEEVIDGLQQVQELDHINEENQHQVEDQLRHHIQPLILEFRRFINERLQESVDGLLQNLVEDFVKRVVEHLLQNDCS